jgi:ribonuclease-3
MSGPLRDAKTELQEWAHRRGFDTPAYVETLRSGPDHAPQFEVEVNVGGLEPGRGRGRSKREAEHDAATEVLRREGVWCEQ